MDRQKVYRGLSVFATGYVKRWMEGNYDRIMMSSPGKRLMELDAPARYGIEAALYAAMAIADGYLPEHSPWQKFLKDIVIDAPPEISKRLVNGFREDYLRDHTQSDDKEHHSLSNLLLSLKSDQLKSVLEWAAELPPDRADWFRTMMSQLSKEEMAAFAALGSTERHSFIKFCHDKKAKSVISDKAARSSSVQSLLDAARERVREEHRQLRERRNTQ